MSYTSGMMKHRITVQNRKAAVRGKFGIDSTGPEWEDTCTVWAAVDFVKGLRAMREGALDIYSVVMIRTRYTKAITERSRILYEGKTYQVLGETLHADFQANTVQFNAQVIINDKPMSTPSSSELNGNVPRSSEI